MCNVEELVLDKWPFTFSQTVMCNKEQLEDIKKGWFVSQMITYDCLMQVGFSYEPDIYANCIGKTKEEVVTEFLDETSDSGQTFCVGSNPKYD